MPLFHKNSIPAVKIDEMNNVHYEELELLNELHHVLCLTDSSNKEISEKLNKVQGHIMYHFSHEEQLMQTYDCPSYAMHKYSHDAFLNDFGKVARKWENEHDRKFLKDFLEHSLLEWLIDHIDNIDKDTAEQIYNAKQKINSKSS